MCKEALFFLKIGVASKKFRFDFADSTVVPNESVSTKPRKTGFLTGIGMDYAVAKNWAVGGEFLYETYSTLRLALANVGTLNYKPKVTTFNLRLRYTF